MKKMKIYLIRHGETEYNEMGKIQGHLDIPLSPEGCRQADVIAKQLLKQVDGKCISAVYSSDLERTSQTAQPFIDALRQKGYDIPVHYMPELREINLGIWQGRTREELLDNLEDDGRSLFARWLVNPADIVPENGESMPEFYGRVIGALYKVIDENKSNECNLFIFTHSGCLSIILNHINGNEPVNFVKYSIDNASGIILEYKDGDLLEIDRI
jgi:broad specificity phosphatase PhoE